MVRAGKALVPVLLFVLILAMGCARKPPTITSISPSSGPSGGGTKITITGTNFKVGATVTIAGKLVKEMSIDTKGITVTAVTPGGPPGPQQVIATNVKAKQPSVPATFTYEGLNVVSTEPADGAKIPWSASGTEVSAKFSQPIQPGSATITISEGVAGDVSYDEATQTATFTASGPLKSGQSFTATVSGARDMAENVMPDFTFGFSIEEVPKVDWYTVQEGDSLPGIAARPEVYEDETKWALILEANQDREFVSEDGKHANDNIIDQRRLSPGMVLYIPR